MNLSLIPSISFMFCINDQSVFSRIVSIALMSALSYFQIVFFLSVIVYDRFYKRLQLLLYNGHFEMEAALLYCLLLNNDMWKMC